MTKIYFILLMVPALLFAQFGLKLDYSSMYTSNTFYNYHSLPDFYQYVEAYANYDVIQKNKGLRLFYDVDAGFFKQYTERNSQTHNIGTTYFINFNKHRYNGGLDFLQTSNSETYKYYQYAQYSFDNNLKLVLAPSLYGYIGAKFFSKNYNELDVFSFAQSNFYLRFSKFFNSGTTLIMQMDYARKTYLEDNPTSPLENLPDLQTSGDGTSEQIIFTMRGAQSLAYNMGLSSQFTVRKNSGKTTRYLGSPDSFYYSDDEIFNDSFSYNSTYFMLKLKKKINKWDASLGASTQQRNYTQRLAMDLDGLYLPGEPLRQDTRNIYWVSIAYQLNILHNPTSLSLDYSLLDNQSNDPYYTFKNSFVSFGIKHSF